ncbi:ABC transporter ATP-binding protein [Cellulomonas carbonis]|uniref:ABC transporter n=1 Tax=Cellulomonas carbonis T26 TaxID=947969 RepID=A0A0A0BUM5_9CELL|nr:ABC transporter ATP-binding protein [Cellulomonas carbonis]KGM11392.1 ABC transporter [Cellulomonas carbonis T26]GGC00810.1 ABC transporter ATP-binding protein [Cellulomonas carbonis]
MTAPLLTASALTVGYGEGAVCAPVSFAVGPGDVLALVGPNGSGKSTVLRSVLGLLEPLAGSVELDGRPVDERRAEHRAAVAAVLDDDAWFPALTTREHLLLTASGHGVHEPGAVVDDALDTFGLDRHGDAVPTALSSGQRRRLLLAAAFVRPRRLLVLDEPEQRLDASLRRRLADLLRAEADTGRAVLLATHDPVLLEALDAPALGLGDEDCPTLTPAQAVAFMGR